MANNKITGITIQRNVRAYASSGFHTETIVFVMRANNDSAASYSTNPITRTGKISDASVRRAKRAQNALIERRAMHDSIPDSIPDDILERAKTIYNANEGNVPFSDCIDRAV